MKRAPKMEKRENEVSKRASLVPLELKNAVTFRNIWWKPNGSYEDIVSTELKSQHSIAQVQTFISREHLGEIEIFLRYERPATTQVGEWSSAYLV